MSYSRYFLCDLQVHTPADKEQGYGDVGGKDPHPEFARSFMEAFRDAGVQVVAVTDHNRVDWYPVLREAGDAVGVFVFPGLEFSVQGCHLLAIWNRTDEGYKLAQRFVSSLWEPGGEPFRASGEPRPVTRGGVLEMAREAVDHQALVFAPHCTRKGMGLFAARVCRNSNEVAQSGFVSGFDVVGNPKADVLTNPRTEFGDVPPRWLITGDTRSFEDLGKRVVYLKLGEEPALEGLRQAFLMPETRVRFPESLRTQWEHVEGSRFLAKPMPDCPRLADLEIAGGFHDGMKLSFGPGLNAIIGGKGTGKTTLVEILRYVLEAGEPLEADILGNRQENFAANAEASLTFLDLEGDAYEVRRSGDETPALLYRGGAETDVAVQRRIRVSVFGQRELRALVDRPELLRGFVASQAGSGWTDALSKETEIMSVLRAHDAELTSLEQDLEGMEDAEAELADVRDKLKLAEEKGVADLIRKSKALAQADRKVRTALEWPDAVAAATGTLAETLPAPAFPEGAGVKEDATQALAKLDTTVRSAIETLGADRVESQKPLTQAKDAWEKSYQRQRREIAAELAEAGITNAAQLERLQRRLSELEEQLRQLPAKRERRKEVEQLRRGLLQKLTRIRRKKSRLVEGAGRQLSGAVGSRVRLRVDPLADKQAVLDAMSEALRGQQVRREQLERLVQATPFAIADAIRKGADEVEALGVTAGTAGKLAALPGEAVRELEEAETPDMISVEIDLGAPGSEKWTNVKETSPGQRATALLALALASGNDPLIIDQPEDDLDNRYIYEEVVKVLARVCESRQVIVATHNANIPVLGDAEMIVALDAVADRGHVVATGGLENPEVAAQARQILEGGDEAFKARHRRYLAAVD